MVSVLMLPGGQIIDSCNIYLTSPSLAGPTGIFLANAGVTKILKNLIHDLDSKLAQTAGLTGFIIIRVVVHTLPIFPLKIILFLL